MPSERETKPEVTVERLVKQVRRLASIKPDNVYHRPGDTGPTCYYSKGTCTDGSVGCIMGQALGALGYEPIRLKRCDELGTISEVARLTSILNQSNSTDREALLRWLRTVQDAQDAGLSWGAAVSEADRITKQKEPNVL